MEKGNTQLQKHDYRRAALDFQNAIRLNPKAAEGHYQLALAYLGEGEGRRAAASLWKALELDPKYSAAELKLSELAIGTRDRAEIEAAEQRLRRLVESSPSPEAFSTLATATWELGKHEEAEKILSDAATRFPGDLRAAVRLAQIKAAKKDFAGAEAILKTLADTNPSSADAAATLGQFYMATGRADDARQQLHRALAVDKKHGAALVSMAELEWRSGHTDQADQLYKEAASLADPQYKPMHAIFLFRSGKRDLAVAEFEKIWKLDPTDRVARTRLIAAYRATGRISEADRLLSAALRKNPKDVNALLQRTQVYVAAGKYSEAQADMATVLRFEPDSAMAHFMVAKVFQKTGATLRYREELTEALRLQADLLQARLELAELLTTSKAPRAALDILNQTPDTQKNELAILIQRNWAYLGMGDWAEARKGIDALLRGTDNAEALVQDGTLKLTQRNFAAAREAFERALKTNPDDYKTLNLLVQSYDFQNQLAAGVERIRRHAAERPNSAPVQFFWGELMSKMDKREEARRGFTAAKAADPGLTAADVNLARLDALDGKLDEARKRLSGSLERAPANIPARLLLGAIEDRARNRQAAVDQYRKVLDADDGNVEALNNLAYLLTETDKQYYDEALALAQKAKERAPDNAAVQSTLGWVLYRKGLYSMAIPYLEQAVATQATGLRKSFLAAAYLKSGNQRKAHDLLRAALQMDPALAQSDVIREISETERGK